MDQEKRRLFEKLDDLKRRLESDRGKERDKTSVEREVADIILKNFRSIIKTTIDTLKEKKKPQLGYEVNLENEKKT